MSRRAMTALVIAVLLEPLGGCAPGHRATPPPAAHDAAVLVAGDQPTSGSAMPPPVGARSADGAPSAASPLPAPPQNATGSGPPRVDTEAASGKVTTPAPPPAGPEPPTWLRHGTCSVAVACSELGSAAAGKATLTVLLDSGKVTAVRYRSECAPPVRYRAERSGLDIDVVLHDWLIVPVTVERERTGSEGLDGPEPPGHEARLAFQLHATGIDWNEPTRGAAATGTCGSSQP